MLTNSLKDSKKLDLAREFIKYVSILEDKSEIVSAYSNFDHLLKDMNPVEQLKVLECSPYTEISNVAKKHKTYIAALTEYLYNKSGKEPPKWVWEKDCYLDEETFPASVEIILKLQPDSDIKESLREQALPEFKRRNYIITSVLNSY